MTVDSATRIECALRLLPARRDQIDADELALIEQARALGWPWTRLGGVYGFSAEGARRRHIILNARRREGSLATGPCSPGEILRATLKALGMSQAELARTTGLSAKHVNQIVKHEVPLSVEAAIKIEGATGVPAMLWNTLEAAYRDALARKAATP